MSGRGRNDRAEVERRLAEMLAQRALEVPEDPDESSRPLPSVRSAVDLDGSAGATNGHRPDPGRSAGGGTGGRWLAATAALVAVVAVVAGGVAAVLGLGDDDGVDPAVRIETATDDGAMEDGASDEGVGGTTGDGASGEGGAPATATLDEVAATLPDGVDLDRGSTLWLDGPDTTDPERAAQDYLADRLPDLATAIELVDVTDRLHLFRWSVLGDDAQDLDGIGGWLIVRLDEDRAGVAAATTDRVSLYSASRNGDSLAARVDTEFDEPMFLDVTDLWGTPVDGAADPDEPELGTAGVAVGGDRLEFTATIPPWPVAVRVQHAGGTRLTITEIVLDPADVAPACGSAPPVEVEVGDRLGPRTVGPSGRSSIEPVDGQGVWHHPATEASLDTAVEIRWPADPKLVGRFPLGALGPDTSAVVALGPSIISSDPGWRVTGEHHVVLVLGPGSASDPCALVQLSVLGDPATADWWSTALSGQSSFGLPLSVAGPDLDPLLGPDGQGSDGEPAGSDELVAVVHDGVDPATVPRVAPTGSCDGLPDDPPRRGVGDGSGWATAAEALAAFVAGEGSALEPPLPTTGYDEYRPAGADDARLYVFGFDDVAIVTVDVELGDDGWRVVAWEAAPC